MTEQEHKICPVCGKDACIDTCAGDTCSQECARTHVIVEVGRELLVLLRAMATPVYYIDKLPLISQEDAARIVASGAGTSPPVPPFARTPLPPEPPWGDGPKPGRIGVECPDEYVELGDEAAVDGPEGPNAYVDYLEQRVADMRTERRHLVEWMVAIILTAGGRLNIPMSNIARVSSYILIRSDVLFDGSVTFTTFLQKQEAPNVPS